MNFNDLLYKLEDRKVELLHLDRDILKEKEEISLQDQEVKDIILAQQVIQEVAEKVQEEAHAQIAGIVSLCLQTVFEEDAYDFRIKFEKKRGKTEARLVFARNGSEIDPVAACGGGVIDVAAFALRVACLTLQRPPLRRLLVLDEPFKYVSQGYLPRVREMLLMLSEKLNMQLIVVTHCETLCIGKVVNVEELQ